MDNLTKTFFDAMRTGFDMMNKSVQPVEIQKLNERLFNANLAMAEKTMNLVTDYSGLLEDK